MRATNLVSLVPMVLVVSSVLAPRGAAQESERARKLFVTNCATCHGETGDGKGTTQLDRPARSFMDGGFSFGNTPEQLFKTISTGIPGTPMPGFDSSLSEEERKIVASYVVTLGPPIEEVKEEDMILTVHDRPLVVRGLLPSLGEGLPQHPRGLLIGDPSGITFEYTVGDVRLLALRQGGFVKRTDWTGRGGTPLEPLGRVVHLVHGGKPEALFFQQSKALVARLSGTRQDAVSAALEYHLVGPLRTELAHVTEEPRVVTTPFGTGYERRLQLQVTGPALELELRSPGLAVGGEMHALELAGHRSGVVARGAEPPYVCFAASSQVAPEESQISTSGEVDLYMKLPSGSRTDIVLTTIVLTEWNETVRTRLEERLGQ
jgi:mono/diheme cytochrome c family protein